MVRPIHELSDDQLSALIEKVEAAQPLNHRYFHWIEHLRRYLLFYWSLGVVPEMMHHASSGNTSFSLLMLLVPLICWFASPRLADAASDVKETAGDVIRRCARVQSVPSYMKHYERVLRWLLWWGVLYSMIYAATHLPPLITCCVILTWCALYQRFTSAPASSYDLSRIIKYLDWQESDVTHGNPLRARAC
jgi:hypothetical protein